jgi:hypothetical protein
MPDSYTRNSIKEHMKKTFILLSIFSVLSVIFVCWFYPLPYQETTEVNPMTGPVWLSTVMVISALWVIVPTMVAVISVRRAEKKKASTK